MEEKMSNVNEYLIPDYVFEDIRQSLRERMNRYGTQTFISFFRAVFDSVACEKTKMWFSEHPRWSPKFVAHFVKQGLHKIEYQYCLVCGKELTEKQIVEGRQYCSNACQTKSEVRKENTKKTTLKNYGVDNPAKSQEVLEKRKKTTIERYGVEHTTQLETVKSKARETLRKHYGVDVPMKSTEIKERLASRFMEKYGVENPFELESFQTKAKMAKRKAGYETFLSGLERKRIALLSTKDDFVGMKSLRFRCKSCGTEWGVQSGNVSEINCPECTKRLVSRAEKELVAFVKSVYDGTVIENDRKLLGNRKELDIVVPEKRLAIEFDGDFYHSDLFKDKNYHLDKTIRCEGQGYRLIHVFEHEWLYRRSVIESIISSALGVYERRIYARQCSVEPITNNEYRAFLEENHLQTPINSSLRFGLRFEGELVAIVGFGQSRFKNGEYELHRFCTKRNYQVIGALSKLTKHSGVNRFITYVDRAHFTGRGYLSCGFELVGTTTPSYVYTKMFRYLNRMACQKHKLPKLLGEGFDPNKSEYENMTMNGWNRIYDCGNLKLQYAVK